MKRALVTNSHDAFFRLIFPLFEPGWLADWMALDSMYLEEGSGVAKQSAKVETNRIARAHKLHSTRRPFWIWTMFYF